MIQAKLKQETQLLQKQREWLIYSLIECEKIGLKKSYTIEEFGKFETLCSRYARSIDFLIRKFYRTLDIYEFENSGTLIDVVNNAHKKGLFEDIDELRMMQDLRNTIVHEYIEEELQDVFDEVLEYSKKLLKIIDISVEYAKRYIRE